MKNVLHDWDLIPLEEEDLMKINGGFGLLLLPVIGFVSGYIYEKYINQ